MIYEKLEKFKDINLERKVIVNKWFRKYKSYDRNIHQKIYFKCKIYKILKNEGMIRNIE